jgi:hypothetical protein
LFAVVLHLLEYLSRLKKVLFGQAQLLLRHCQFVLQAALPLFAVVLHLLEYLSRLKKVLFG